MRRIELVCPACRQVNVRYGGWTALFLNPKFARKCTLCQADLAAGDRDSADQAFGRMMWMTVYFIHVLVGCGILTISVALVWPDIFNQPLPIRIAPVVCGAVSGLVWAEHSRRSGTLLGRPRRKQDRRKK